MDRVSVSVPSNKYGDNQKESRLRNTIITGACQVPAKLSYSLLPRDSGTYVI